ncbi:U7 snRNA-associated Sm-like protein LSm11 [Toxorhynchites rutilus septentrionalis]|uniref:U7 snRNA-associated Sm-like protein LSm11 n=1 Tax=Toxorhynchites rutilus septentrionalis TaxID=329112 RepID=UPI00247ADAA5|nr:U7 snRNA-associated Sm-like protein LSm11 [Toxorhynchites rutilus septentrionalis]
MSNSEERSSSTSSEGDAADLDISNPNFKPLRVLYSRRATVPAPNAEKHDNVSLFESKFKRLGGFAEKFSAERLKEIQAASSSKKIVPVARGEAPVRRFLPHQEMIRVERPARFRKNIFTKLENYGGPLNRLRDWMSERVRVKIYTRKEKGIRGYVTGFVEVFDKHWNVALSDVFESWERRKYRYSENKLCNLGEPQDCSEELRKMGISVPAVNVKSVDSKCVICTRRVPKLLIRGEQIVLIVPELTIVKKEPLD